MTDMSPRINMAAFAIPETYDIFSYGHILKKLFLDRKYPRHAEYAFCELSDEDMDDLIQEPEFNKEQFFILCYLYHKHPDIVTQEEIEQAIKVGLLKLSLENLIRQGFMLCNKKLRLFCTSPEDEIYTLTENGKRLGKELNDKLNNLKLGGIDEH